MITSYQTVISKQGGRRYPLNGGPIAHGGFVLYLPSQGRAPAPTPYQRVLFIGFENRTIVVPPN